MLEKRRQSSDLPRCGEWIAALVTLPSYVVDEAAPYKPTAVMWLESETGWIVDSQLVRPEEALQRAPGLFQLAMREPAKGKPRKPVRLRVSDEALARALQPSLGDVELVVAATPEIDDVVAHMTAHFDEVRDDEDDDATYLLPGVDAEVVAGLFRAAARLYRARPWDRIPGDVFVGVSCNALGIDEGAISVVGQMGQSFGFALFRSIADAEQFLAAAATADRDKLPPQLMFNYDVRHEMPEALLREVAEHGWEVAGPTAYPWAVSVDDDLASRPLVRREQLAITAIADALAHFVETTPRLAKAWDTGERVGTSVNVETVDGTIDVRVWAPLFVKLELPRPSGDPTLWTSLLGADGYVDNELVEEHFDAVMSRFVEAMDVPDDVVPLAELLVQHIAFDLGTTIVAMTPMQMGQLLLRVLPKRAMIEAENAGKIVAALDALLELADHELGSKTATSCRDALEPRLSTIAALERELRDEGNFGHAKALFLEGKRAGFDMTSEADIAAFVAQVNAQQARRRRPGRGAARKAKAKAPGRAAAARPAAIPKATSPKATAAKTAAPKATAAKTAAPKAAATTRATGRSKRK